MDVQCSSNTGSHFSFFSSLIKVSHSPLSIKMDLSTFSEFCFITQVINFCYLYHYWCANDWFSDKEVLRVQENKKKPMKFDTTGSLTVVPTPEDDDMPYTCEAKHPAIEIDRPMRATVKLSVFCKFRFFYIFFYEFKSNLIKPTTKILGINIFKSTINYKVWKMQASNCLEKFKTVSIVASILKNSRKIVSCNFLILHREV